MNAKRCFHNAADLEIVSITPVVGIRGLATLHLYRGYIEEFNLQYIAAWTLVRLDTAQGCECPHEQIVPLIAVDGALVPQIPAWPDRESDRQVLTLVVEPGTRAVARVHADDGASTWFLTAAPGSWVAGEQGEDALEAVSKARRSAAEGTK